MPYSLPEPYALWKLLCGALLIQVNTVESNKLVLANASGDAPDIATGINYAQPYELAIRGALKDSNYRW